jgi:DNA-binding NtrC family response regulator
VLFPEAGTDKQSSDNEFKSVPTGTERILLVDDEDAVVETGRSILEKLGYRVEACTDPQKALDEFRSRGDDFDLVITDMSMPHLTGEELSKQLMDIRPSIPIILCTGYSEQFDAANADAMGIQKFLIKPLEMIQLANIIRDVLDEKAVSLVASPGHSNDPAGSHPIPIHPPEG